MDIEKFLFDNNITYKTEGKNWQPGWVQINCPFCDDPSFHGGFNIGGEYYNCWHCGFKQLSTAIMSLINIKFPEAKRLIREYSVGFIAKDQERKIAKAETCKLPIGTDHLWKVQGTHWNYLTKRKFNPQKIIDLWKLGKTGPIGNYKFRLIAPVIVDGVMVSYQGRDITDKQTLRYKACPIEEEVIHHKHVVYGIDYVKNRRAIIVEGITDVWRLGPGAIAMFGIEWTNEQLLFLKKRIDGGMIVFDSGAEEKGERLMNELNALGANFGQAFIKEGDPGNLKKSEAEWLMKLID